MTDDLAEKVRHHMAMMGRCGSKEDAVKWMAAAYNLLDACANFIDRPKMYVIPGSFGERIYTVIHPEKSIVLPPVIAHRQNFPKQDDLVIYGDRYQNRAWTRKDTRQLEKENARRAAEWHSKHRIQKLGR